MTDALSGEPGRWRTFGTRGIYESPELWLDQMDVELPNGERVWEHVVRLPQAALMALLDDQRRVLLVWRHRFVPDMWLGAAGRRGGRGRGPGRGRGS